MELFMKASGRTTCTTEEENCTMLPVICMKENSQMTWLRASVSIGMQTEASMSDIGTKTSSMDLEKRNGTIAPCTKASTKTHQKKVRENTAGQTATDTLVNGHRTCSTEEACSSGMTIACTWVTGKTT